VLVEEIDILAAIDIVVAHCQSGPVIVQVDAEALTLLPGKQIHVKGEARLLRALLKTRFFLCATTSAEHTYKSNGDCERGRDRARFRFI